MCYSLGTALQFEHMIGTSRALVINNMEELVYADNKVSLTIIFLIPCEIDEPELSLMVDFASNPNRDTATLYR